MSTKKATNNQTNEVLASIPDSIKDEIEKCAKECKSILFEAMPFNGEVEKKQNALVDLVYQVIIDPKEWEASEFKRYKEWFPLKTIDCVPLNNKKFQEEITSYLRNPSAFHILHIKNIKNVDGDVLADICKLQEKIEKLKSTEYSIYNLTANEIDDIENGKTLYYNRAKKQVTNNTKDHQIIIRELSETERDELESLAESQEGSLAQLENGIGAFIEYIWGKQIIISSFVELPDWFQNKFEPISLDGDETVIEPVAEIAESKKLHEEEVEAKQDITPKPLFMDDKKNVLYLSKDNRVTLRPEEIKLIEYMRKQDAFELKQILAEHFNVEFTGTYKHSKNIAETLSLSTTKPTLEEKGKVFDKGERNIFDTYKSNINKKCNPLGIGDLIIKQGDIKKAFKLSVKITKKIYHFNVT